VSFSVDSADGGPTIFANVRADGGYRNVGSDDGDDGALTISYNVPTVNSAWKNITNGWIKQGGTWKPLIGNSTIDIRKGPTVGPFKGPTTTYTISYLVVGGGASGNAGYFGVYFGAGGAGGCARTGVTDFIASVVYTATIGLGGAGVSGNGSTGNPGGQSSLNYIVAPGGGVGVDTVRGGNNADYTGATPYIPQAAGGGAGAAGNGDTGGTVPTGYGLNGGNGLASSITGTAQYYGGGGAGLGSYPGHVWSAGLGADNYGGGSSGQLNGLATANGNNGVVIISVPTSKYSGIYTGSPIITHSGTNTIITFTSNGTYTA
jgi:hypothetical protein